MTKRRSIMVDTFHMVVPIVVILVLTIIIIGIARRENKKQIHYMLMGLMACIIVWTLGITFEMYKNTNDEFRAPFVALDYFGLSVTSVMVLLVGWTFSHTYIKMDWKIPVLFIMPIISTIITYTNPLHHLMIEKYSCVSTVERYGKYYFPIHSLYCYGCILIGMWMLISFSIKNSGIFSRQARLIIIGTTIPLLVNFMYVLHLLPVDGSIFPIMFAFFVICIAHAMIRFQFLGSEPISLQTVVDSMLDSFVLINDDNRIIDFNKPFIEKTRGTCIIKRNDSILDALRHFGLNNQDIETFKDYLQRVIKKKDSLTCRKKIESLDKYYDVELTPIFRHNTHICTIIMLKDVTEYMSNLQTIRDYQLMLEQNLEEITKDKQELLIKNAITEKMAHTDALTEMYNHRTFQEYFDSIIEHVKTGKYNLQLAIMDIDNFKEINDTFGHAVGDVVLKRISSRIKSMVTKDDIPARYGGEEFAIIFNSKTIEEAFRLIELLRKTIALERYREIDRNVTVSVGLYNYKNGDSKEIIFKKADTALYEAKKQGKNRTIVSDTLEVKETD